MKKTIFTIMLLILSTACSQKNDEGLDVNLKESFQARVSSKSGLVLRDKPSTAGSKILSIPIHNMIEVTEISSVFEIIENRPGNWVKAEFQGKSGWVFGGFLEKSEGNTWITILPALEYFEKYGPGFEIPFKQLPSKPIGTRKLETEDIDKPNILYYFKNMSIAASDIDGKYTFYYLDVYSSYNQTLFGLKPGMNITTFSDKLTGFPFGSRSSNEETADWDATVKVKSHVYKGNQVEVTLFEQNGKIIRLRWAAL